MLRTGYIRVLVAGACVAVVVAIWIAWVSQASLSEQCIDWWQGTRREKALAGPAMAAKCQAYFSTRTATDVERDQRYLLHKLEAAQKAWATKD